MHVLTILEFDLDVLFVGHHVSAILEEALIHPSPVTFQAMITDSYSISTFSTHDNIWPVKGVANPFVLLRVGALL